MNRTKGLLLGLLLLTPLVLASCSYLGFESPTSTGTYRPLDDTPYVVLYESDASITEKDSTISVSEKNRHGHCPDRQVAKLLLGHDFDGAKFLLEEDLDRLSSVHARRCVLLSFAMLYAMPESTVHNLEKARAYQLKAQQVGGLEQAAMDVQFFNKSISSLLFTQQRNESLETDTEQLRLQLEKKDALIDRLKKLTLGED